MARESQSVMHIVLTYSFDHRCILLNITHDLKEEVKEQEVRVIVLLEEKRPVHIMDVSAVEATRLRSYALPNSATITTTTDIIATVSMPTYLSSGELFNTSGIRPRQKQRREKLQFEQTKFARSQFDEAALHYGLEFVWSGCIFSTSIRLRRSAIRKIVSKHTPQGDKKVP
jgi:hypothetical protein